MVSPRNAGAAVRLSARIDRRGRGMEEGEEAWRDAQGKIAVGFAFLAAGLS